MKTLSKIVISLALVSAVPLSLVADDDENVRPGYGGMGYGMGPGMMRGYGYGPGMMGGGYYDEEYQPIPEKEAKMIFEKYIDKHLKGFKITKMDKQRMPMGDMYWVVLKDASGNEFELHLNPFGRIRGPFVK